MLRETQLKQEAFQRVNHGARWIIELASQQNYNDAYTRGLDSSEERRVMPIAEVLMCLVNLREYKGRGVKQPPDGLIDQVTKDLLRAHEEHGFSGRPYLIHQGEPEPPFTDAVCFTAGALTAVLSRHLLKGDLEGKAGHLLMICAQWLLDAQIQFDEDYPLNGSGWSWSSPKSISKISTLRTLFAKDIPPQTYFSSSAFITLCEILFDLYSDTQEVGLTEPIFKAIVNGKAFLLSSLFNAANKWGWTDIGGGLQDNVGVLEALTNMEIKQVAEGLIEPEPEFTLYGLEPLSYVKYYLNTPKYAKVAEELKKNHAELFEEFSFFSPENLELLNSAFKTSQYLAETKTLAFRSCLMQVPEPLNEKQGEDSYYLDGTVGFTLLNVFNFYVGSFSVGEDTDSAWSTLKLDVVERLISTAYDNQGFAHFGMMSKDTVPEPAIYATRTAIATLLSWGAEAPSDPVAMSSPEVKDLVGQLYTLICGAAGGDAGPAAGVPAGEALALEADSVTKLLELGFIVGLLLQRLSTIDKVQNLPPLVDIKSSAVADKQILVQENGLKFLSSLQKILTEDSAKVEKMVSRLGKQRGLAVPYRTFLDKNQEQLIQALGTERLQVLHGLQEAVKEAVIKAGDRRFGEICDG